MGIKFFLNKFEKKFFWISINRYIKMLYIELKIVCFKNVSVY